MQVLAAKLNVPTGEELNSKIGISILQSSMTEEQRKIYQNKMAMAHEELVAREERERGNLAWRVAREYDVLVITKGETWLVDCKRAERSELDEFIIDNYDIVKLLNLAAEWTKLNGTKIRCRFNMWFARTRQDNNRRYIDISEADREWSIRCWKTADKIMTKRVRRGSSEER